MEKKRIILISVIAFVALVLIAISIYLVISINNKNEAETINQEDIYNRDLSMNVRLPSISGNENTILDEFGKKTNTSADVLKDKKWMNLDFTNFEVYSTNEKTSVISFKITNNNYMAVETGKFQLQLKDNTGNIVSLVDFEELSLESSATMNVTVNVTGDITNVKDIVIDEITYKMNLQEVE